MGTEFWWSTKVAPTSTWTGELGAEEQGAEEQGAEPVGRPGRMPGIDELAPTLGSPVTEGRRRSGLADWARLLGRPGFLRDVCEGRRGGFCKADLGGGIPRSTWLVGVVVGVESTWAFALCT
ncbi:unnamed protein product [Closterium sp. NIES-54]